MAESDNSDDDDVGGQSDQEAGSGRIIAVVLYRRVIRNHRHNTARRVRAIYRLGESSRRHIKRGVWGGD